MMAFQEPQAPEKLGNKALVEGTDSLRNAKCNQSRFA